MSNPCASSIDHSRHHDNVFEEGVDLKNSSIVDEEKETIRDRFRQEISTRVESLLRKLERNRKHYIDSKDFSIYTGTTGIAYLYYHYGKNYSDRLYIDRAMEMIERSLNKLETSKRKITFLCGNAGPLALGAVIHHLYIDKNKSRALISDLRALSKYACARSSDCPDELLYGRAGYLYAILFVNRNVSPPPFDESFLKEVIECILKSGAAISKSMCRESPLMYSWHDKLYLGGAHGLAGILFVLLQALPFLTEFQIKELLEPSLQYLIKMRFPSGNFPSSVGNQADKLVHWCHGAPSMTILFCKAYSVFGNPEYLQIAMKCGDVVWSRGLLKKGYGLCHGVAGNAYTFLYLFQLTKDVKHLYRASKFAEWCMDYGKHEIRKPDRPFSLFEGLAGTIYFLIDIQNPLLATFPGYGL